MLISKVNKETKGDKSRPIIVLHILLDLVGVIMITTLKLLIKLAYLGCLHFIIVYYAKNINCIDNTFINNNIFTSIDFLFKAYSNIIVTTIR